MARERGTMQRGLPNGAQEQGGWPEPTAPAGRRLPSAPRERKPALAALALLLIIGGALGAGFLVLQSGKRVAAIAIIRQVGAGQRIPLTSMQQVQVASDTGVSVVPWADASQVARYYAVTTIPSGTLLSGNMVVPGSAVTNGKDVLGLALKDGQWPGNLAVGDHVAIYSVGGGNTTGGCPQSAEQLLAGNASVLFVSSGGGNGSLVGAAASGATDVTVAVSPASAAAVACNAAAGNVAIAVLPAGGTGVAASPPATAPGGTPAKQQQSGGPAGNPAVGASGTPSATRSPAARTGHG